MSTFVNAMRNFRQSHLNFRQTHVNFRQPHANFTVWGSLLPDFSLLAHRHSPTPLPLGSARRGGRQEGDSSATSGSQLNYRMTAMSSTAGCPPPPSNSIVNRLLEFCQEFLESCSWVRMVFEACGGVKCLSLSRKPSPSATPVPAPLCRHEKLAS